jgi:hypothetical protein
MTEIKYARELIDAMSYLQTAKEIAEIHPVNKMMVRVWEAKVRELEIKVYGL